jgi:hypothetical protein
MHVGKEKLQIFSILNLTGGRAYCIILYAIERNIEVIEQAAASGTVGAKP